MQGFNGIQTRDLCDTSAAMLCQLSYEATHWERGQFVEFISPSLNYFHIMGDKLLLNFGAKFRR